MKDENNIWLQVTTFWIAVYQAPFIIWNNIIKEKKKEPKMKYIKTFEDFVNENKENSDELNERERLRFVGTYRAKDGNTYKKFKDDENYISIQIGSTYVTIEGDGEVKTQDEVMKEILAAKEENKANRNNPLYNMSNSDFKKHMRGY